jgi:hypothetical protein
MNLKEKVKLFSGRSAQEGSIKAAEGQAVTGIQNLKLDWESWINRSASEKQQGHWKYLV